MGSYLALKALREKEGSFLILKRGGEEDVFQNEWGIPRGDVEFGEAPKIALRREVREETGLGIEIIKPIRIWC